MRVGLLSVWVVLVRLRKSQEVLKICNGKCIETNLACNGKNRTSLTASELIDFKATDKRQNKSFGDSLGLAGSIGITPP